MLVVNAANIEKDLAWVESCNDTGAKVKDMSEEMALIALQGPQAIDLLNPFVPEKDVSEIPYFRFTTGEVAGSLLLFHVRVIQGKLALSYVPAGDAKRLWSALYPAVTAVGGQPVGLGARDTLRLEAGLRLYGTDMNDDTNPFEVGLGKFVRFKNRQFIGKRHSLHKGRRALRNG